MLARVAALTILVAVLLFSVAAGVAGAQAGPTISLSRASGPCGSEVDVRGSGFRAGDTVFIEIFGAGAGHTRLATVTAGPGGDFVTPVAIGQVTPPQQILILAYPLSFGPRRSDFPDGVPAAPFSVTAAAGLAVAAPRPPPALTIFPPLVTLPAPVPTGRTTVQVEVRGSGFVPGETVYVERVSEQQFHGLGTETQRVETVTADCGGRFSTTVALPAIQTLRYYILAYAESFGPRTAGSVQRAPRQLFAVTIASPTSAAPAVALPGTGVGVNGDAEWTLAFGARATVLAAASLALAAASALGRTRNAGT